jgi:signal transduction histidine kinase
MFSSIKTKMSVVQTGIILSVVICLGVMTYRVMLNALVDSQKTSLEYLSYETSYLLDRFMLEKSRLFKQISSSGSIDDFARKQQDAVLVSLFAPYTAEFSGISYASPEGMEQFKFVRGKVSSELKRTGDVSIFAECLKKPNTVCSVYEPGNASDKPRIEFGYRNVNFFDECLGFIKGTVLVSELVEDIEELRERKNGSAILVDSEGTILACPDAASTGRKLSLKGRGADEIIRHMRSMESGYGRAEVMSVDSYFAYSPVAERNWFVIATIPYEEFRARLGTLRNTVVLVGGIVLAMSIALMLTVGQRITRPILLLTERTAAIAKGDFSQRVEINSSDEIGMLAESFNRMQEELRRTTTSISNLNAEVGERKKVENQLIKANENLETMVSKLTQANRELEEFAHITAHDLKTPLRAIGSLAGIIASDYNNALDDKGRQYLAIMLGRVERMNHFIKGILRYSEMGRKMERQWVDMGEIVCEAVSEAALPQDCLVTKAGDFPMLHCNRAQMTEVFSQLLSNAIKYLDKPVGQIKVACEQGEGIWRFSVSDNGCGIDQRYLDKIFRIFQTLNRRDEIESTGIGLSLVRKIVETYDGKVWVESRPGQGSTFYFTLPAQDSGVVNEKLPANSAC